MNITVNEKTLTFICNESNAEIIAYLNNVIDEELLKDNPDCALIDECVNTISELEACNDIAPMIHLALTIDNIKKIVKPNRTSWKGLNIALRVAIVAAVIAASTLSVNAAVGVITGESVFERIGIAQQAEDKDNKQESEVNSEKQEQTQATVATTTALPNKDDSSVVSEDDSNTADNRVNQNDSYVIKGFHDSGNLNTGDVAAYKKKGNAIKKTYTFTQKDNFDEKSFLRDEYGPVGMYYCEGPNGNEHQFSQWVETTPSNCKDRGKKQRSCSLCGAVQVCPTPKKEKHICSLSDVLEPANNDKDGRCSYICNTCGEYFERKQPKPKHLVLSQDVFYYNGKAQRPKVIAVLDANGDEISKDNYTVEYFSYKSVNVYQEYFVAVNFNSKYYEYNLGTNYFIRPMSNDIKGISSINNGMVVFWNKNSLSNADNTTGYVVEYSKSQNFSSSTKIKVKGMNTLSKEITGLSSGDTYYVRMRVYYYDEISCVNVYSTWSSTRAVVIK